MPSTATPVMTEPADPHARMRWTLFALGLLISCLLVVRCQAGGDQLNLLARGWLLAARGQLVPYGNPLSTGGDEPGPLTSVVVGVPMMIWRDHRAPVVLILVTHVLAYLLLDRTLRTILAPRERLLFCVAYWLNPWRLYFSGFLWNPNYLFLPAAIHFWASFRQWKRKSALHSIALALAIGFAAQLHASAPLLVIVTALLWWRGYTKIHWPAAIAGSAVVALTLVPWVLSLQSHPEALDATKGYPLRGLVEVAPIFQGVFIWLRYGSLWIEDRFIQRLDFTQALGPHADAWLAPSLRILLTVVACASILVPLVANVWLWRRRGPDWRRRLPVDATPRQWLTGLVGWTFASSLVVFALSPTQVMWWQIVLILHVAVLPVVLWAAWKLDAPRWPSLRTAVVATVALSTVLMVAIGLGAAPFRCGGRRAVSFPLAHDSPMFEDLGMDATCPVIRNAPGGWWPDVLPPE